MAKKAEIGGIFFIPRNGFTVPGKKEEEGIHIGDIVISDGLAKELFGEEEQHNDKDAVTITGRNISVS